MTKRQSVWVFQWPSDQVTKSEWPSDQVTEWPSDQVTEWPSDWVTKWPSDWVTESDDRVTKWPNDQVTELASDKVSKWPSDWVTKWPNDQMNELSKDQMTGWQDVRKLRRRLTVWYIVVSMPMHRVQWGSFVSSISDIWVKFDKRCWRPWCGCECGGGHMLGPAGSLGRARIWALVFTGQHYREMQTTITRYSVFITKISV